MKRRAIESMAVAGSLVLIGTIAGSANMSVARAAEFAVEKEAGLEANAMAGVTARLGEFMTDGMRQAEALAADIQRTRRDVVASGQSAAAGVSAQATEWIAAATESASTEAEATEAESAEAAQAGVSAQASELMAEAAEAVDEKEDLTAVEEQPKADAAEDAKAGEGEPAETAAEASGDDGLWDDRLMANVDEFLYVRADDSADSEAVGKLYKGAVAEVVESGDTWTHVVSGNVDGYVRNDYCLYGQDAKDYAESTVETKAKIEADGLRVRSSASEDADVIASVSTGTTLSLDTGAKEVDGWVAVKYGGQSGYVSAEYVTMDLDLGEAVTIEEERAAAEQAAAEAEAEESKAQSSKEASSEGQQAAPQQSAPQTVQNAPTAATADDATLLAAIIQCEAGSECYEGQVAVGAVVMNRVRSGAYPGSIYGVIYDPGQFTPAATGQVAAVAASGPSASCMQAAQAALAGTDNTGGALYFCRAGGRAGTVIGNHVFY